MPWLDWDMCSDICHPPWFKAILLTWNFPVMVVWIFISLRGYTCIFKPDYGLVVVQIYTTLQVLLFVLSSFRCWSLFCCFYSVTSSTLWLGGVSVILKFAYEYVDDTRVGIQKTYQTAQLETAKNAYVQQLNKIRQDLDVKHRTECDAAKAKHATDLQKFKSIDVDLRKRETDLQKRETDLQKRLTNLQERVREAGAEQVNPGRGGGRGGRDGRGARGARGAASSHTRDSPLRTTESNQDGEGETVQGEDSSSDELGPRKRVRDEDECDGSSSAKRQRDNTPPLPGSEFGFGGMPRVPGDSSLGFGDRPRHED